MSCIVQKNDLVLDSECRNLNIKVVNKDSHSSVNMHQEA